MRKAIIGFGGFGREVYWSLPQQERKYASFFVDDEYYKEQYNVFPLSKLDTKEYEVVVAIGDPLQRQRVVESLPEDTKYFTHIHHSVIQLGNDIKIGEGSIICAGTILTTNIILGRHTHLNLQTTIGHDVVVGDYFTTAPGAKISGNCEIGNNVYVGTNASIKQKINICNNVIIGLNAGVVKDITESGIYGGVPVKKLKV